MSDLLFVFGCFFPHSFSVYKVNVLFSACRYTHSILWNEVLPYSIMQKRANQDLYTKLL